MKRTLTLYIYIFFLSFNSVWVNSQELRIGIFRDYSIKNVAFDYSSGSYSVYGDTSYLGSILPGESVQLQTASNNLIAVNYSSKNLGTFSKVYLIENQLNNNLTIQLINPKVKIRRYKNDFEVFNDKGNLSIVNIVDESNYLEGVIESEGGGGKELAYYEVQALISRTYLYRNINRHQKEGFSLCDRVHCQAYHNMLWYTPRIDTAVKATAGLVLVDSTNKLIDALFHANCGGQTSDAKYVWNNSLPYLQAFKDTFCIYTKQATWEKRLTQQEWADFLVNNYNYPINDSVWGPLLFTFNQPDRLAFYHSPILGIPLRDLRTKFNLKSTFFNTYPDGTDIILKGRGYGHGVGLCQEGAMKMAFYKYNFRQISLYYYPEAKIIDRRQQSFYDYKNDEMPFDIVKRKEDNRN